MWSFFVVLPEPLLSLLSDFAQALKHKHIEHGLAVAAIEPLNETILHGLARFDELEQHAVLFGPVSQRYGNELRPIIQSQRTTRGAGRLKSTSMANSSRLKSSTTLKVRKPGAKPVPGFCYCGHSPFVRLTTGLSLSWYSAEVMNEQTIACCFGTSRIGARLIWPSQNRKPPMSASRRK